MARETASTAPAEGGNPNSTTPLAQIHTLPAVASQPVAVLSAPVATRPVGQAVLYDTTIPKAVKPRDVLERMAQKRGLDFDLVDRLMDKRAEPPPYNRLAPPPRPADARIAEDTPQLDESNPFPSPVPLPSREVTLRVGVGRSTYHTRTPEEVLAAILPFIDIVERDVAMRPEALLYTAADRMFYDMGDGKIQLGLANIFDYYLIRGWFANYPDNRAILLEWAQPANPYTTQLDRDAPGPAGTGIVLVVANDASYKTFGDLKGARLSLPANYVNAPGAFLTRQLMDIHHPFDQAFFGQVTLRRYSKDVVLDLLKDKADVACVDEGTLGALTAFYGIDKHVRVLAVSPHYNVDVLFTSQNNVRTHQTQIELAERMLLTLGRDPEGQMVLFFFDIASWNVHHEGDLQPAVDHFDDFLKFTRDTPADLKPLLNLKAPVDRRTYDRYGDE
jgi:ABC-type phosphate/phosphonate transport system substrate-binding protein